MLSGVRSVLPERLAETFVELADTLVPDFDSAELLHRLTERCVELLGVDVAGILLAEDDQPGSPLRLVACSTERARVLELFRLDEPDGPFLQCYRTSDAVAVADVRESRTRWPAFADVAGELELTCVHAVPMRLREQTLGSLNLLRSTPLLPDDPTARVVQALADAATIGLLHNRALSRQETLTEQLRTALDSRVAIEQAKGVIAEALAVDMQHAFELLRNHGRSNNRRLRDVCHALLDGTLTPHEIRTRTRA